METIGCSGMTHSAAMAAEILIGKTILEALNTDLVCDAINTAMRELFLQIAYGRSQCRILRGRPGPSALLMEDLGQGPAQPGGHHVRHAGPRARVTWRWPRAMSLGSLWTRTT